MDQIKVVTNSYVLKPNTQSVIQNRSMMDRLTEDNCILKLGTHWLCL